MSDRSCRQDHKGPTEKSRTVLLETLTEPLNFRSSAPMAARRILADVLMSWGLDHHVGMAQLCTTELVTDALRNGEPPLILVVLRWTDRLQVTIVNGSEERDRSGDLAPFSESRIRTRIVQALAVSWGVESVSMGTAAWFDVDTQPGRRPRRLDVRSLAPTPAPDLCLPPQAFN
jgi:hypothetical protein